MFLIGSLVSIAGLGVSVYGCYKLWKKNKNPKTFVDSWQKTENAAELLDEKTILLEDEDDRRFFYWKNRLEDWFRRIQNKKKLY